LGEITRRAGLQRAASPRCDLVVCQRHTASIAPCAAARCRPARAPLWC